MAVAVVDNFAAEGMPEVLGQLRTGLLQVEVLLNTDLQLAVELELRSSAVAEGMLVEQGAELEAGQQNIGL